MANRALQTITSAELAEGTTFNERQVELIRSHIAPDANADELMLFLQVASSRGLDPFRKHIYAVSRYDSQKKQMVTAHQVSIEGLRLIAERSGKYEGQIGPFWCGEDGIWRDIWLDDAPPLAAKVGVYKLGFRDPLFAVAKFKTFVQKTKEGNPTKFWAGMPEVMIAKVAEAAALRRAFPEEAGGLYVTEEMDQAANEPISVEVSGRMVDRETGEIIQANPRPAPSRSNSRHAAKPSDADKDAKARKNIIGSIHGFGVKWGFSAEAMDAATLNFAGAGPGDSIDDLPVPVLSKAFNDLTTEQRKDPPGFEALVQDIYRLSQDVNVIDVDGETAEQGELIGASAGGFDQ